MEEGADRLERGDERVCERGRVREREQWSLVPPHRESVNRKQIISPNAGMDGHG